MLNFTVSCTSWLGKFITEFVPYAHVMLDGVKENYVLGEKEYLCYTLFCYADFKVNHADERDGTTISSVAGVCVDEF